jgi:L-amino acid N-acyltransferase YncA
MPRTLRMRPGEGGAAIRTRLARSAYRGEVPQPTIRPLTRDDWPDVARIYAEGLATGVATFEVDVPSWSVWDAGHLRAPRLVAEADGRVVGWLAASPVSSRDCYRGVVEHSVYVDGRARGLGVGRALLERLVAEAPDHGIWTIQTSIMAGNAPSLALHESVGFRVVGFRERIAQRDGVWHDTVLLELRLP